MNIVILSGNLGKDVEIQASSGGKYFTHNSIAVRGYNDTTNWINITAWGKIAEIMGDYLKKGDKVTIAGEMKTDSWDDKNTGKKNYKTYVIVNKIDFMSKKDSGSKPSGNRKPMNDYDDNMEI